MGVIFPFFLLLRGSLQININYLNLYLKIVYSVLLFANYGSSNLSEKYKYKEEIKINIDTPNPFHQTVSVNFSIYELKKNVN